MSDQKFCVYITKRTLNSWSHGNQMNFNWWLLVSHQKAQCVILFSFACIYSGRIACLFRPSCLFLPFTWAQFSVLTPHFQCFVVWSFKNSSCLTQCCFNGLVYKPVHLMSTHIWQNWPELGLPVHEPVSPLRVSRNRNHSPSPDISSPSLFTYFGQTLHVQIAHFCRCQSQAVTNY